MIQGKPQKYERILPISPYGGGAGILQPEIFYIPLVFGDPVKRRKKGDFSFCFYFTNNRQFYFVLQSMGNSDILI